MSEETIEWVDEIAPLTEEQWDRIIAWHRLRLSKVIPGLVAAKEFSLSMIKIQQMPGQPPEKLTLLSQSLMEMAEPPESGE